MRFYEIWVWHEFRTDILYYTASSELDRHCACFFSSDSYARMILTIHNLFNIPLAIYDSKLAICLSNIKQNGENAIRSYRGTPRVTASFQIMTNWFPKACRCAPYYIPSPLQCIKLAFAARITFLGPHEKFVAFLLLFNALFSRENVCRNHYLWLSKSIDIILDIWACVLPCIFWSKYVAIKCYIEVYIHAMPFTIITKLIASIIISLLATYPISNNFQTQTILVHTENMNALVQMFNFYDIVLTFMIMGQTGNPSEMQYHLMTNDTIPWYHLLYDDPI